MTARRLISAAWIAVLAGSSIGCDDGGAGLRYRAERDFWRTHREAQRLDVNPDLVGSNEMLAVADRFLAVGARYAGELSPEDAASATNSARAVARIGARAKLLASEFYLRADDVDAARKAALEVREELSWDPAASMHAQVQYVDVLRRGSDADLVLEELWHLAEAYPAASEDGSEVHNAVFNSPMNAVRHASLIEGVDRDAQIERALAYYDRVRERWPDRLPALLADLHRASLWDAREDWRRSAGILETVLDTYEEEILQPIEAARVAYTLGRVYAADEREVPRAVESFERAMKLAPRTDPAWDSAIAVAEFYASRGRFDDAGALYRRVAEENADDTRRAPLAAFAAAQALQASGRWEEARRAYDAVQANYPRSTQARQVPFVVAAHYRDLGESEIADTILRKAEEEMRALIETNGESAEAFDAHRYLFEALAGRGEWEIAVREMEAFAIAHEGRPEAALILIQAAEIASKQLDDDARAADFLGRVQTTYPNSTYADRAAELLPALGN